MRKQFVDLKKETTAAAATTTVAYVWNKKQFYQIGYADSSQTLGFEIVYAQLHLVELNEKKRSHTDTQSLPYSV